MKLNAVHVLLVAIPLRDITSCGGTLATAAIKDDLLLRLWFLPAEARLERGFAEEERVGKH